VRLYRWAFNYSIAEILAWSEDNVERIIRRYVARRETEPGFSLDGRQRWGAQQILLEMPNTTYAWCNL
jgi:hypothetical protein